MNQIFDINRTMLFAKLKFSQNRKMLLIGLAGYFGLIFIITFFMAYGLNGNYAYVMNTFHTVAMGLLVGLGGIWVAGRSYQDMNSPEKSMAQIMVPASTFEKYIVPLIFSTVLWVFAITAIYQLYAFMLNGMWSGLFGKEFGFFNIFDLVHNPELFDSVKGYLLVHSIFFLGGIAFKRYPIAKTVLSMFVINICFTVIALVTMLILFGGFIEMGNMNNLVIENRLDQILNKDTIASMKLISELVFTIVIPIILYIAAFFKLKEREV
jgi:hypothetical protein